VQLKEHVSKVLALLLYIPGKVVFETEAGFKEILLAGDYERIDPNVKHWVDATILNQLMLLK